MKTTTVTDLNRPANLDSLGITNDNANQLKLVSVRLKDGRDVEVNRPFASQGTGQAMTAQYNLNGRDLQFRADPTTHQVSLEGHQESEITGYTIGIA